MYGSRLFATLACILARRTRRRHVVNHKGVEYEVAPSTVPGVWKWRFWIEGKVKSGETETKLAEMAARRAQLKIDQELRKFRR
jgi:hypothetical protein